MKDFKLADYGNKKRVNIEAKRFQEASHYIRRTKKKDGIHQLWVRKKEPSKIYKMKDFKITRDQRRVYGSGEGRLTLVFVKIKNKETGQKFNDWVRPDQIRTVKSIDALIDWR